VEAVLDIYRIVNSNKKLYKNLQVQFIACGNIFRMGVSMEQIQKVRRFNIKLNRENVLRMMDSKEDSHNYQEVILEYEGLKDIFYRLLEPIGIFKTGRLRDFKEPVVYLMISIGDGISSYSTRLFQENSYLKGMLINVMADEYLFSMHIEMIKKIEEKCGGSGLYIKNRIDPSSLWEGRGNEILFHELQADKEWDFILTGGAMFSPVKSMGEILVMSKTRQCSAYMHSCEACTAINCSFRRLDMRIIVLQNQVETEVVCKENESLLEALQNANIFVNPICAGRGICGKCKVRLVKGKLAVTDFDRRKFTPLQLQQGFRLSCKAYPDMDCTIEISGNQKAEFEVITNYADMGVHPNTSSSDSPALGLLHPGIKDKSYVAAIDIGTTTIVINLVGNDSKQIVNQYAGVNKQRDYGSDVISRILASNQGKKHELQQSIRKDLLAGIKKVIGKPDKVNLLQIIISANTTMTHLLLGYSCADLGTYPFTPVHINTIAASFYQVFGEDFLDVNVTFLPGISAFVGGDITAGLYNCNFDEAEHPSLFVDLGTNGEMAVGNKEKIFVTSTAAGPAFEGGNITWGVSSIEGAISGVNIINGETRITTIGDKPPIGLCGTGVVETAVELLKAGYLSDTGLLNESYFESGFPIAQTSEDETILLMQADIRELQLAKAAIRAGIETLLLKAGISCSQLEHVYLAGGFGFRIEPEKAVWLGLFPEELMDKILPIGNSSLAGAVKYAVSTDGKQRTEVIIDHATEINLANDPQFNELYMTHMFFEKSIY